MIALFLISTTLILMGGFGSMGGRQPFSLVEKYDVDGYMVGTLPNLLKAR